nr:tripartite tricarboxylate transporter TctB family protein [Micromonospora sp. DSM 115978]
MARDAARPARLGPRVLGAVVLGVAVLMLAEAYRAAGGDLDPQGPWLAPVVVTGGWTLVAAWYLIAQFAPPRRALGVHPGDRATATNPSDATDAGGPDDATGPDDASGLGEPVDPAGEEEATGRVRWRTPAVLAVALCGYVFALDPVGFVPASALVFVAAARILGSRRIVRDAVTGVLLALAIYLAFTRLLDIGLPSGVLPL